jgi:hypothetical protein
MEKDEQLQKFLKLCENSSFPHREEIFKGINEGKYLLESKSDSKVPSEQMLDIYQTRAKIVAEKKGLHAERLKNDILSFVEELKEVLNDRVNFWRFSIDESSHYVCFEGVNSKKILGCILAVDKRKVSEDEWGKLWSK